MYKHFALLLFIIAYIDLAYSQQQENKKVPWGIQVGYGTQQAAPFNSTEYYYEQRSILGSIHLKELMHNKINLDIWLQSGYFNATHQLLNKWFTTTHFFDDFPEDFQQKMLQQKTLHQVVAQLAIELTHYIFPNIQLYGYAAIGPMWVGQQTERLAKGLAFSDNLGLGMKFKIDHDIWLNSTLVLRHESNANLKFPNSGHNTIGLRLGLLFNLAGQRRALVPYVVQPMP